MAAPQNFRSAFNGFNREDVVHYIEYVNSNHTTQINQLTAELDSLRRQLEAAEDHSELQEQLIAAEAERDEMQQQLAEQQAELDELREQLEDALTQVPDNSELEARCAHLEQKLREANAARAQAEAERDSACHRRMEQELEAYRRAERTERLAKERAEQVYRKANGALADATVIVDEAFAQIGDLTDRVSAQLAQLQTAVGSSKQALSDAAATLYTIRPGSTEA